MKKAISISLVVLLLLNVLGYYGLFIGLKYKNTLRVTSRIEAEDYLESETVTIAIPLSIPYYGDTEYERVDGEIQHEGQFYRLVKQKLQKDTLYVVCIRDTRAERIHEALTDYVRTFADQTSDHSNTKIIQSRIKDYCPSSFSLVADAAGWIKELSRNDFNPSLSETFPSFPSPPPKA